MAPQPAEARAVIVARAQQMGATVIEVGRDIKIIEQDIDGAIQLLDVKGRCDNYYLKLPLLGRYQSLNAAAAVAALEVLAERGFHITKEAIEGGLAETRWPGRFDIVSTRPLVILDGAHNPASARELKKALGYYLAGRKIRPRLLVFGTSLDKDIEGMVRHLTDFDRLIITRSHNARAMDTDKIVKAFGERGLAAETAPNVGEAIGRAKNLAGPNGMVVVTGSLFVVGEALKILRPPAGL